MKKIINPLLYVLIFLSPTQLGKHFWLTDSLVMGRKIDYLSPTLYLIDLVWIIVLTLFIVNNRVLLKDKCLHRNLVLLSVISVVFLIVSPIKLISLYFIFHIWQALSLFWIVKITNLQDSIILKFLSLGAAFQVVLMAAQFIGQKSVGGMFYLMGERSFSALTPGIAQTAINGSLYLRPYGTFPHPNAASGFLTALLPLFLFTKEKKLYLWRISIIILLNLGIFLSFSRSAWIITIIMSLALFYIKTKAYKNILFIGIFVALFLEFTGLFRLRNLTTIDIESVIDRQRLMDVAIKMWQGNWLFGVGAGLFIVFIPLYLSAPYILQPVHSVYLLFLSETGILGLGLFGALFFIALYKGWKNEKYQWWGSGLVILTLGLFDHYFITLPQTRWLMILVLIQLLR